MKNINIKNCDNILNVSKVLFLYENVKSNEYYVITETIDGINITYELEIDLKKPQSKISNFNIFTQKKPKSETINLAHWLGESNDDIINIGSNTNPGDLFECPDSNIRRRLTDVEESNFLSKEYNFSA